MWMSTPPPHTMSVPASLLPPPPLLAIKPGPGDTISTFSLTPLPQTSRFVPNAGHHRQSLPHPKKPRLAPSPIRHRCPRPRPIDPVTSFASPPRSHPQPQHSSSSPPAGRRRPQLMTPRHHRSPQDQPPPPPPDSPWPTSAQAPPALDEAWSERRRATPLPRSYAIAASRPSPDLHYPIKPQNGFRYPPQCSPQHLVPPQPLPSPAQ